MESFSSSKKKLVNWFSTRANLGHRELTAEAKVKASEKWGLVWPPASQANQQLPLQQMRIPSTPAIR